MAAIDRLIWMPGLDAGWNPQGLTLAEGSLFVSGYQSNEPSKHRGPCRIFRIDPETGAETGHFDVPPPCGHAGGLAYAGGGKLFLADTHALFEIDLDRVWNMPGEALRFFQLGRGLKGAFAISDKAAIWIGDYEEEAPAKIFKFDLAAIGSLTQGASLDPGTASVAATIPTYGQGGAIDPSGKLWISRSNIGWGFLDKINVAGPRLENRYAAPAGIEGIAFDENGRLWGVAEAGARHQPLHYPFFPLIFRLDPGRLAPTD